MSASRRTAARRAADERPGVEDEVEEAPCAIAADVVALAHGERERHGRGREAEAPRERPHPREAVPEQRDARVDRVAAHAVGRHAAADASARLEHERREPAVAEREGRAQTRNPAAHDDHVGVATRSAPRLTHGAPSSNRPPPTSGGS